MSTASLLELRSAAEWGSWLEANHDTSAGVWLAVRKKRAGSAAPTYEQAVEEALCWGWIDSKTRSLDADRFQQWFSPRRHGGTWAPSNKQRVARLVAEGRMRPEGLAAVEAAKADGSWNQLDEIESLAIPNDLADALAADEEAAEGYERLPDSAKKQLLYWIDTARRRDTRASRVQASVEAARRGRLPGQ